MPRPAVRRLAAGVLAIGVGVVGDQLTDARGRPGSF